MCDCVALYLRKQMCDLYLINLQLVFSTVWSNNVVHDDILILFFDLGFMARQDYFTHYEPSQS